MKIKLLECVAIDGTPTAPNTIVEVSPQDAASLIRRKMAEQAEDGPAPDEGTFLDNEEPKPQPKRRGK